MEWHVEFHSLFDAEFVELPKPVRLELLARVDMLRWNGPNLGRPYVDTLKDSRFTNMKELRFDAAGGVWRAAFAFDPERNAIVLVAGDKRGRNIRRFYRRLIETADTRYEDHLAKLRGK